MYRVELGDRFKVMENLDPEVLQSGFVEKFRRTVANDPASLVQSRKTPESRKRKKDYKNPTPGRALKILKNIGASFEGGKKGLFRCTK